VPPGRIDQNKLEYFMPTGWQLSFIVVYWAVIAQFVFSQNETMLKFRLFFGPITFQAIFLTFVIINAGFSLATLGFVIIC
jgi:hypothetical protein